jgi:hypothetical protein
MKPGPGTTPGGTDSGGGGSTIHPRSALIAAHAQRRSAAPAGSDRDEKKNFSFDEKKNFSFDWKPGEESFSDASERARTAQERDDELKSKYRDARDKLATARAKFVSLAQAELNRTAEPKARLSQQAH